MNRDTIFRIPPHVIAREVGHETVILDLENGIYFGLDPIGARVWSLIDEGRSVAGVCAAMLDEYEVEADELERDVLKLTEDLTARDLLRVAE